MLASPIRTIADSYPRGSIGFIDRWVDMQYDAANVAAVRITQVLAGQREFFDFCLGSGQVVPLNVAALYARMMRFAKPPEIAVMIAALASLDPDVRVRGMSKAHEFVRILAGEHGDNEANRACGVVTSSKPRFAEVYCSQCGRGQGPGNEGFSSCSQHLPAPTLDEATTLLDRFVIAANLSITGDDKHATLEETVCDAEAFLTRTKVTA